VDTPAPSASNGTGRPSPAPKTEQEIYELGQYCHSLMQQSFFNQLCAEYEEDTVRHMLQTLPHEVDKRERIYASMRGQQDFLGLLMAYVEAGHKIANKDDGGVVNIDDEDADLS
jgi:hypothetical protein